MVILYDNYKKLLAINEQTLEMLGYASLEEFKKEIYDVAQLFLRKPGYIYEFRSFHWIDYVLTNNTVNHRALLQTKDGRVLEVFVKVLQLSNIAAPKNYYLVTFELNTYNECEPFASEQPATAHTQTSAPQTPQTPRTLQIEAREFAKPNITQISEELNLSPEIVEDFIKEYINQALEKFDEIQESLKKKDKERIYSLLHTLKGVAANLRLKPAFDILAQAKKESSLDALVEIIKEYYSYILYLSNLYGIETEKELHLTMPEAPQPKPRPQTEQSHSSSKPRVTKDQPVKAAQELGLSLDEYQAYLKELINEIKLNLAYNNYNELHKLASFARNLYLQECAKYLDQVSVNQNPELVRQCIRDLEQLKNEPNPFIITKQDLDDSLQLIQIDKQDFIDILEDLVIELKTLHSIKMKKEKFLKKAKQLKSVAESLRLSNLVLLLNNIISNYPLDKVLNKQFEESIASLEKSVRELE